VKYVIVQGDGMADRPVADLGGRTPLEVAHTPHLDRMASRGILGMTATIPKGMPPGSDVGTMSVLGYDPRQYHTGRSPIEAASLGVELGVDDVAFRCNLVCVENVDGADVMRDFTAGHISSEEARPLLSDLESALGGDGFEFHAGLSYRHLLVWRHGVASMQTTPPHDITGQPIASHLPQGAGSDRLCVLIEQSRGVLREHPINRERRARGEREATQIWLWGQGTRPRLPTLKERFGLDGVVIAAVDLVNGLGVLAGLERIRVPGATGYLDTDYGAKAEYGLRALADHNFLFLHVEAPDEAGHMGDAAEKVKAIEAIDSLVIGRLFEGLVQFGDWRLMVLPDHPTPCALKTHSDEPVPFTVFSSTDLAKAKGPSRRYTESDARDHGIFIAEAHTLIERLLRR
jgi:2,3-bisphosphoglycerate-independent phosphoglycerate mutase